MFGSYSLFLSNPDFKCSCLWRNTVGHEICMTYPYTHTGRKPVEVHRSSEPVKDKSVIRNVKPDNGKRIAVTNG